MGVPEDGWFIVENPNLKWMMTGGTPMTQETSILDESTAWKVKLFAYICILDHMLRVDGNSVGDFLIIVILEWILEISRENSTKMGISLNIPYSIYFRMVFRCLDLPA